MPFLFFLLLVLLIATVGFWNTLGAVLGAVLLMALAVVVGIALVVVGALWALTRRGGPSYRG